MTDEEIVVMLTKHREEIASAKHRLDDLEEQNKAIQELVLSVNTTWQGIGHTIIQTVQNPFLMGSIVFAVMGFLGVTNDPTTKSLSDSEQALEYKEPK